MGSIPEGTSRCLWRRIGEHALYVVEFESYHFCRPDTLDPALLRPGRLDRRVEFSLPDNEGRAHILRIHARRCVPMLHLYSCPLTIADSMSVERDIRFDLIARLCPNTTGAELRSVATEVMLCHP
jgi:ATP-dependent 26S proteasome regulatory subunit